MRTKVLTRPQVARVVHFLKLHLVGKRIVKASAIDDANVFGKVGTTGADVAAALTGNKVCATKEVVFLIDEECANLSWVGDISWKSGEIFLVR